MSHENLFLPTVERLAGLIGRRYSCAFRYQSVTDLMRENLATLRQALLEGEPVTSGDWVFFPVFVGENLAGAGCISNRDKLNEKDLKYLNQIVKMVLEGGLSNIDRLDLLSSFENHIESALTNNVVTLQRFQKNLFPLAENDVSSAFNFPFLIESRNSDDLHKMAIEIHSRTNRYAILPIEDISPSVFSHPDGLHSLGHLTIFVKDITTLPLALQSELVTYYRSQRSKECPQIIAGTLLPISELKASSKIHKDLLQLLMIGYLCMTRSFAEYKRENVLDFFYDSLTGRTSV